MPFGQLSTIGLEEEYLIVDPHSRETVAGGARVLRQARPELGPLVAAELTEYQIEARTEPCLTLNELEEQVRRMRAVVGASAVREGLEIVASGTSVLGQVVPPKISESRRYERSVATYRALDDEQSTCACHIHINLPDRERAILVSNHLRLWLPSFVALTANSPFWGGRDTGYASWRCMSWARWPVAGPPPYFESLRDFEDLVGAMLDTGVFMDRGMIYWDIRPSDHVPTLEVRVADVGTTAKESVLLAALVRALVMVATAEVERGQVAPRVSHEMLRAAYWRSARDGLNGHAIDVSNGRLIPVSHLIERLIEYARPALIATGDLARVTSGCQTLMTQGGGASRRRRRPRPAGSPHRCRRLPH